MQVEHLESGVIFPSLHHRKEGWLRHQKNFAKPPKPTQPGWFSFCIHRKTTPASRSEDAARHFIDRSAAPPCGDARRGMAAPKHSDIFSLVRTRPLPMLFGDWAVNFGRSPIVASSSDSQAL